MENLTRKQIEQLEEIQAICIGADSPDAIEHGIRDPIEELQCCREDISAISNIVEQILEGKGDRNAIQNNRRRNAEGILQKEITQKDTTQYKNRSDI